MSDTYRDTETMTMPGQPEIDFESKTPIWEILGLDVDLSSFELKKKKFDESIIAKEIDKSVDWSVFDFSSLETQAENLLLDEDLIITNKDMNNEIEKEIEMSEDEQREEFFKNIEMKRLNGAELDEVTNDDEENEFGEIELIPGKEHRIYLDNSINKKWVTPPEWLKKEEFKDHVGYDVWNNYNMIDYGIPTDDMWQEDDQYHNTSISHILSVLDIFLNDHNENTKENDSKKYLDKIVAMKLSNNTNMDDLKDPIPKYLTPDIDRGVEYSMTVLEMKGKISLEPKRIDPQIEFKDDVFTPNEELNVINKIGSCRDQYDWTPTNNENWEIDENIVKRIQPVLTFVNYCCDLKSTKVSEYIL